MITIASLIIVCILISVLSFYMSYRKDDRIGNAIAGSIISFIIASIIVSIIAGSSYISYIELKQKSITIKQYSESINLYSKLTVPNRHAPPSSEITDLKYQNYQVSIKELIEKLRQEIVCYNKILIGKRELGNNIIFNWLIIMPGKDMKNLKIEDFISIKENK